MIGRIGFLLTLAASCGVVLAGPKPRDGSPTGELTLHPRVRLDTTLGSLVLELDAARAPGTVKNFVQYVNDGFYNGTIFHRVIRGFMIQAGAFTPDLKQKTDGLHDPIKNEWRNGLKNKRGTIAMARLGNQPDSARASFYINLVDTEYLDKPMDGAAYCVFGRVVQGMDTVEKIRKVKTKADRRVHPSDPVLPADPIIITNAKLLDPLDTARATKLANSFEQVIARAKSDEREAEAAFTRQIERRVKQIEKQFEKKMTQTPSGLRYLDVEVGGGPSPRLHDLVVVHYRGTLADGSEFDNSRLNLDLSGQPFDSILSELIDGWAEGLQTMHTGGTRILVIPPELGHGTRGHPKVGRNLTLFYEIELMRVIPITLSEESNAQSGDPAPQTP